MFLLPFLLFVLGNARPQDNQADPGRFLDFLESNRAQQCRGDPMPLSYAVPDTFFDGIPPDERIPPNQKTQPTMVPVCDHQIIQPGPLEEYQFETERYIASSGLNIYDGSLWCMAMSLLGENNDAVAYEESYILGAKTCQLGNIRGSAGCEGVILDGQCSDPDEVGKCGFCYGSGSNAQRTLDPQHAWLFRTISDYWAYENTVDLRCPERNLNWIWNDYKPVLGENAWANMIGPLQVALLRFGTPQRVPDNDISLTLARNFVQTLVKMQVPGLGCVYYSPKNTLENLKNDFGFTFSTENNISLLAGLRAFLQMLTWKNIMPDMVSILKGLIRDLENFLKQAYDPSVGYFKQGGRVATNGQITWFTGDNSFAVDCQTWAMTVLGPKKIDKWYGNGTAHMTWINTKKLGGYHYHKNDNSVDGLGYTINQASQAFSGEWTFGAVNMLRVFAHETGNQDYMKESNSLRDNINSYLTETFSVGGKNVKAVKYANKRYFIPFGWFANPVPSLASTTWAVFADSNFNPFFLGGNYTTYP